VWAWGVQNIYDLNDYHTGTDIESFINFISRSPSITYFHNLAFDGIFILDYLLKAGYEVTGNRSVSHRIETTIDGFGKFYRIIVHTGKIRVEFRDSLKKLPMSVKTIAKTFNLPIQKGEIDYKRFRPVGYSPTDEEWEYVRTDVEIMSRALVIALNMGMAGLTVASDTLKNFKASKHGERGFRELFPIVPDEWDDEIRRAYRGGYTYVNPRYAKRLIGPGHVYDVNSLYPTVMRMRPLPYGMPQRQDHLPEHGLFVVYANVSFRLKPDMLPCIQLKNNMRFVGTEYLHEAENVDLGMTSVDLALYCEHYDFEINDVYYVYIFKSTIGLFDEYTDKWKKVKEESTGGVRTIAKLYLNSLYGKFGTRRIVTGKRPILRDGRVVLTKADYEERDPVYTAMACFITAWARDFTVRACQMNYASFCYADTDSMHLLSEARGITEHPTDFGAWKREADFELAVYNRAKQYGERINGVDEIHVAGLPRNIASNVTVEDLLSEQVWHGKLVPHKVPGGVVLRETHFTYKVD
jgi:hypothetical protein